MRIRGNIQVKCEEGTDIIWGQWIEVPEEIGLLRIGDILKIEVLEAKEE